MTRAQRKRKGAIFGFLPRDVLHHPPIRTWRSLDIAVACALIARARSELSAKRHVAALEAGADAIDDENQFSRDFEDEWKNVKARRRRGEHAPAPQRFHTFSHDAVFKPRLRHSQALKKAGKDGYKRAQHALRKAAPPEYVEIDLSVSALLRLARLSTDAKNRTELKAALRRLQRPIRINGRIKPALIEPTDEARGRLHLRIAGEWLEPPFGRLPLPLPTRSIFATALYLFLQSVRTTPANKRTIDFREFCSRIGIDTAQPPHVCRQAFNRALDVVNDFASRLSAKTLDRYGMKAVARYVVIAEGQRIRFEAKHRRNHDEERAAMAEANGDFETVERVRPTRKPFERIPMHHPERNEWWARWEKGDRLAALKLGVPAKQF